MIDVMENIKKLSAALDAETASLHPSGKLLLLGSQDSVFLKAIKRKADQLGINCDHTSNPLPPYRGIVVDSETVSFNSILDPDVDIDHSYSPGMSAVSQAVMDLLIESGLVREKDITIVGRGHAVKELAKYLDFNNATVTVAHSKTKSLLQATQNRDVVIYATPIITQDISYNTRDPVIATHIANGQDFFAIDPPKCDYIISNPPYSLKGEVFERLFQLNIPFAMLVGVVGLFESQKRFKMFREHDFEIMYLNRRVSYFKNYADQKPSLNPPFSSVYVCKGMLPKQIIFEEIQKTS